MYRLNIVEQRKKKRGKKLKFERVAPGEEERLSSTIYPLTL
jgi:hypothetical protein